MINFTLTIVLQINIDNRMSQDALENNALGMVIRGGKEYELGIFVSKVRHNSIAHLAGLKVSDQIINVNGYDFRYIDHDKAVAIILSFNRLRMLVRHIGKLPDIQNHNEKQTRRQQSEVVYNRSKSSGMSNVLKQIHLNNSSNMKRKKSKSVHLEYQSGLDNETNSKSVSHISESVSRVVKLKTLMIEKCRPLLGIAIESAPSHANRRVQFPRISYLHPEAVDGKSLEGLGHRQAAHIIAEQFNKPSPPWITLAVLSNTDWMRLNDCY
ncbi:hypothetical protein GJ496_010568 [Pomphorhynchus laevis]|nr:hypothetical protein GJ496_010568 [Pomphorhynchus laevis]